MSARPGKPAAIELLLAPASNVQLANLCGALDENLRQIETALDVSIARRGDRFTLHGKRDQTARASEALQMFYARAKEALSVDEIQLGLIELLNRTARKDVATGGQSPALLTRKTELHGRTPRQVEYLKHIQEDDITFGTGAKAVVTGDVTQIDLQRGQKSSLIEARQILKDVRGIAFTEFQKEDVVRHPLVARIVSAYEAHTAAQEEKHGGH